MIYKALALIGTIVGLILILTTENILEPLGVILVILSVIAAALMPGRGESLP